MNWSPTDFVSAALTPKRIPVAVPSRVALTAGRARSEAMHERDADPGADRSDDQPLADRRVVAPAARVGDDEEGDQRDGDEDRRADVAATDSLARETVPERKGEDHRRGQDRLDHGEPPDRQGDRLTDEPERVGGDPGEPDRALRHPDQEPGAGALAALGVVEPRLLLQHRAEREEERRGQRQDDLHAGNLVAWSGVQGRP